MPKQEMAPVQPASEKEQKQTDESGGMSRRKFVKILGVGAAAAGVAGVIGAERVFGQDQKSPKAQEGKVEDSEAKKEAAQEFLNEIYAIKEMPQDRRERLKREKGMEDQFMAFADSISSNPNRGSTYMERQDAAEFLNTVIPRFINEKFGSDNDDLDIPDPKNLKKAFEESPGFKVFHDKILKGYLLSRRPE